MKLAWGMVPGALLLGGCFTSGGIITPYNPEDQVINQTPTRIGAMDYPREDPVAWLIFLETRGALAGLNAQQSVQKAELGSAGFVCPDYRNVRYERVSQIMMTSYPRVANCEAGAGASPVMTVPVKAQVAAAQGLGFACEAMGDGDQDVIIQLGATGARRAMWRNDSAGDQIAFTRHEVS